MTTDETAPRLQRATRKALFGFGMLLPLLGGGNSLFTFGPENAVPWLLAVALGTGVMLAVGEPRLPAEWSTRAACGFLVLFAITWSANVFFRAAGPRAQLEAAGPFAGMLLFAAFARRSPGAAGIRSLVVGLLAGVCLTTVFGQYQYWFAFPRVTALMRGTGLSPFLSVNANFYNANCYAAFLAATALLAVAWLSSGPPWKRALTYLATAAVLLTLALTQSRSAVVVLVAFSLVAVRFPAGNPRKVLLIGLAALAGVALAVALLSDVGELWRVGLLGRIAIWQGGWRMALDNWVVGVGVGRFGEFFDQYRVTSYYTRYPHDALLEVAAETGILGLLPLLSFLGAASAAPLRWMRTRPRSARSRPPLAVLLAAGLLIVHALLDIDWHAPANPILLFLLLGAVQRLDELEPVSP